MKSNANQARNHRLRGLPGAVACLLAIFPTDRVFALDPTKNVLQYNCQSWGRQNGLPVSGVNAISQTNDGYLWLGTSVGLLRFDGMDFKRHDLRVTGSDEGNHVVTTLARARDGDLWVGMKNAPLGHYDGQKFSFHGPQAADTAKTIWTIVEAKNGDVWTGTSQEISRMPATGGTEAVVKSDPATNLNASCGIEDSRGRVLVGTTDHGVFCSENGKAAYVVISSAEIRDLFSMAQDSAGNYWFGTLHGLVSYDADFKRREIPELGDEVRALLADREGSLWIGTNKRGVVRLQNGKYETLRTSDGLAGDFVKAIFEDHEGSIWVGTRDGVSQISDVKFPIQNTSDNPEIKSATAVAASRLGGVWIASRLNGITRYDPATRSYHPQYNLPLPNAKRVFEGSNGHLYIVQEDNTLVILAAGSQSAVYSRPEMVVGIAEDPQGVVVSAGGTLFRADLGSFAPYPFKDNGTPPFYWILNLATGRDGCIWVACNNGIFRVKDGAWQQWSTAEGLSDPFVFTVTEDTDGVVWAGTLSGIARLKDGKISMIRSKDGLFNDNIYSIVPDDLGNLWVDTSRGIYRVSRRNMNDFAEGRTARVMCDVYDGIESVKIADKTDEERVSCRTADGRIWFPGPGGVVMIDPADLPVNRIAPPVHIDSLRANGRNLVPVPQLSVQPGRGELEFHFNALTFISPRKTGFRYRLDGYDPDWVDAGDRRTASYTNLKPGRYTFRVIAANADGVWNLAGARQVIELQPHFYQTTWFYLLGFGSLAALMSGSFFWRDRALKRKQQLLHAEVRHRTAELAETNDTLRHEIEERGRMQREIEKIHLQLLETSRQAGMSEVATSVLHNVGNVLNSVNVSCSVVADRVRKSHVASVGRAAGLLREHQDDLAGFLSRDPNGRKLPDFLGKLAGRLEHEQTEVLAELKLLGENIDHIKEIVSMQQNYAKVSGVTETIPVSELVEDALRMSGDSLSRHSVRVVRHFEVVPEITLEKHKALQILVNLIRNAKDACVMSGRTDKHLTLRVTRDSARILIVVSDNGVGIEAENLTQVFAHGFTTKAHGHGFGLHGGALAAKDMGGSLTAHSDGPGTGATFTLELPLPPHEN